MERAWFTIVTLALTSALVAALAPETEHDALWYHLWLPEQWLRHGVPFDTVNEYVTLYPLTWELVFGAGTDGGRADRGEAAPLLLPAPPRAFRLGS